jgi:hypothetical protein
MFLPECSMPMSIPSFVCRGHWFKTEGQRQKHQDDRHKLFDFVESHVFISSHMPDFVIERARPVPAKSLTFSTKQALNPYR